MRIKRVKKPDFCLFLRFGEKCGEKNKGDFYMNNNKKETLYKYMFPEYPDVVSINQLRKMLGISRHLAYDLVTTQKIYSLRIGNSFKIPKVCVVDYIIENFGNLERNPADETTREQNILMDFCSFLFSTKAWISVRKTPIITF